MAVFKRLDHVSIGVNDLEKAKALFCGILGGTELADKGRSDGDGFDWLTFDLGGKKVEIVSPIKAGQGGVGKYIEKYGEGFHHISISVDNLEEAIEYFKSKDVRVLGVSLESGTWKHCYLHPKDTHGALIQVFEETDRTIELGG